MPKRNPSPTQQERKVLFAVIAEYVMRGKPVSSKSLASTHGFKMAPATVRRYMHQLTEKGFLIQPHVSAGRVPTDHAFRIFVDALKKGEGKIPTGQKAKLVEGIGGLVPGSSGSWKEVVRLLAEISRQAALIITPAFSDAVLRQLKFIRLDSRNILAVVVTREGLVHNAYLESPAMLTDSDVERIHNYLGALVEGRTLNDVRRILREEMKDARSRCDALREKATVLGTKAIEMSVERESDLVIEGRRHLLAQPELKDRIEELIKVLEERTFILDLLDQAAATDQGPLVVIGREGGDGFAGCAMVTAPFGSTGSKGRIGIIGSTRMNYPAAIPLVSVSAQFLSAFLVGKDDITGK